MDPVAVRRSGLEDLLAAVLPTGDGLLALLAIAAATVALWAALRL